MNLIKMNRIKPVLKYHPPVDPATFKQAKCLLTISVGQEVHEGDKFAATVDLVNASFGACILLIDDSLQRHSMALNHTKDADFFYEPSILAGNDWLTRNKPQYERLTHLERIIRWDRWLNHPQYAHYQNRIHSLMAETATAPATATASEMAEAPEIGEAPDCPDYQARSEYTCPAYQASFDYTINEFLRRYYPRLSATDNFDSERAHKLCFDYLLEECTALCLWPELECELEVYPGKRNLAMEETHKRLVVPRYGDILHPVWIKFKNRKQLKPQQLAPPFANASVPVTVTVE